MLINHLEWNWHQTADTGSVHYLSCNHLSTCPFSLQSILPPALNTKLEQTQDNMRLSKSSFEIISLPWRINPMGINPQPCSLRTERCLWEKELADLTQCRPNSKLAGNINWMRHTVGTSNWKWVWAPLGQYKLPIGYSVYSMSYQIC